MSLTNTNTNITMIATPLTLHQYSLTPAVHSGCAKPETVATS